jgi:hypothetical protein
VNRTSNFKDVPGGAGINGHCNSNHGNGGDESEKDPVKEAVDGLLASICSINDFQKMEVPPKDKIVSDWMQEGDIGYIFSPRGVGKTWFAFDMAHSIATGNRFGPWETHGSRPVLYVDGEVAADHMQNRAKALSLHSEQFHYLNHELLFNKFPKAIDVADKIWQQAILQVCEQKQTKVVILDNLSCLAPDVDENDGVSWSSQLLHWTLDFRHRGISLIFIQHAGRAGDHMRGHSRKEDPANWIVRLDKAEHTGEEIGSKFITVFTKNRNAARRPEDYEFWYKPDGNKTQLFFVKMSKEDLLLEILRRRSKFSQKEAGEELGVSQSTISRMLDTLEHDCKAEYDKNGKRWRAIG